MPALRSGGLQPHPISPHAADPRSSPIGPRILEVRLHQRAGRASPVHSRQQQRRRPFQNALRCAPQQIRKAHKEGFLPPPNRNDQAAVGIKFNVKIWGALFAADSSEHTLKNSFPVRYTSRDTSPAAQFLRLTGGGAAFFRALSASFNASCVPSTASSRFSLYSSSSGPWS